MSRSKRTPGCGVTMDEWNRNEVRIPMSEELLRDVYMVRPGLPLNDTVEWRKRKARWDEEERPYLSDMIRGLRLMVTRPEQTPLEWERLATPPFPTDLVLMPRLEAAWRTVRPLLKICQITARSVRVRVSAAILVLRGKVYITYTDPEDRYDY